MLQCKSKCYSFEDSVIVHCMYISYFIYSSSVDRCSYNLVVVVMTMGIQIPESLLSILFGIDPEMKFAELLVILFLF
jgi:hypothetical protein